MPYATIEESACIGCGSCEALCPDVFAMTARGTAQATCEVTDATKAAAQKAINMCPVRCIYWDEG